MVEPVLLQPPHHLLLQPLARSRRLVADRDRMTASLAAEHGGLRQLRGQGGEVEGGRHHHQPQIRPQQLSHLAHQGQGQVGVGAALVELVEDQAVHPLESGFALQPA